MNEKLFATTGANFSVAEPEKLHKNLQLGKLTDILCLSKGNAEKITDGRRMDCGRQSLSG